MKIFSTLDEYTDDDLIIIVYGEYEDWEKDAVEYAKLLLNERGISDDSAKSRLEEIIIESDALWKEELEKRKEESYDLFELIIMSVFWLRYIFRDWNLDREGYVKKSKQRLYSLFTGIILYSILIIDFALTYEDEEQEKLVELNRIAVVDSILKSKVDWSGLYVFEDTLKAGENNFLWELRVIKDKSEHSAILTLINESNRINIPCIGLIKDENLELYSDTVCELNNGLNISYNEKLFFMVKDGDEITTYWYKIKPFNFDQNNKKGLFKKIKEN
jgi:hypothetical protein